MKRELDLLNGDINKLFFHYLIPSVSATLVTSIYIMADTVMIGHGVGAGGIAALNILLPLFSLFFGTGLLFGVGGGVYFSIARGKGEEKEAKEYFTVALEGMVFMSVLYLIIFNVFFDGITAFLGRNETMDKLVREYGYVITAGLPVFVASSFLQTFVRNDKAPKTAMAAVITGGIMNVLLDYILIFTMDMGMKGGAVATILGSSITILILCTHFFSRENTLKLVPVFSVKRLVEIFISGLSSFMIEMSGGIVVFLFNLRLLAYAGDLGVVIYGIISNSALVVNSVSNGISQAAQPLMAVNFGAGAGERTEKTRRLGERAALCAGLIFMCAGMARPDLIIKAFIKPQPEVTAMAVPAIRIYFLSFLITGLNFLYSTYFQSVLKAGKALLLCLFRGVILNSVLLLILPVFFGANGIWATMTVTEFAALCIGKYMMKEKNVAK